MENCKEHLDDMELYFIVNYEKDGSIYTEELIEEGSTLQVSKSNLQVFIDKKWVWLNNLGSNFLLKRIYHSTMISDHHFYL